jgi:hypothetical protein
MLLARVLLGISSLIWLAIGVAFLFWPVKMAGYVDIALPTPTALIDLRATYGGFDLAVGIFFAVCALSADWVRPGLAAMALTYAGFAGGRIVGLALDGTPKPLMYQLLAAELTGLALSLLALWRTR